MKIDIVDCENVSCSDIPWITLYSKSSVKSKV